MAYSISNCINVGILHYPRPQCIDTEACINTFANINKMIIDYLECARQKEGERVGKITEEEKYFFTNT